MFQRPQTFFLIVLCLRVVSPDAVVESGGEAQPGQVGRQQQSGGAADGIPRDHGGSDGPGEKDDLDECLNQAETAFNPHSRCNRTIAGKNILCYKYPF